MSTLESLETRVAAIEEHLLTELESSEPETQGRIGELIAITKRDGVAVYTDQMGDGWFLSTRHLRGTGDTRDVIYVSDPDVLRKIADHIDDHTEDAEDAGGDSDSEDDDSEVEVEAEAVANKVKELRDEGIIGGHASEQLLWDIEEGDADGVRRWLDEDIDIDWDATEREDTE